jgi:outer membrane protein insertion porin family
VRIRESRPRLLTGELGYASGAGITTSGELSHRNFLGGARTLTLSILAETGVLGTNTIPNREFRTALTFRQPWFPMPKASVLVSPFYHYRDDVTDRSWQLGIETSLLYELGPNRALSLTHRYSSRRVLNYRLGTGSSLTLEQLLELLATGALDSAGQTIDRSTLGLTGVIGRYDPTRLADALQARPTIEFTVPPGINTIEYAAIDLPVLAFRKLGKQLALSGRLRAGRVFPFGKTTQGVPSLLDQLELRDVLLTAGGTASVRGWGEGLLGPKFVNLIFTPTVTRIRYCSPPTGMPRPVDCSAWPARSSSRHHSPAWDRAGGRTCFWMEVACGRQTSNSQATMSTMSSAGSSGRRRTPGADARRADPVLGGLEAQSITT